MEMGWGRIFCWESFPCFFFENHIFWLFQICSFFHQIVEIVVTNCVSNKDQR